MAGRRTYLVSEVAGVAGVSARTLHHDDDIGHLVPKARTEAGYRVYDEDDLPRLQQVLLGRELGLAPRRSAARSTTRTSTTAAPCWRSGGSYRHARGGWTPWTAPSTPPRGLRGGAFVRRSGGAYSPVSSIEPCDSQRTSSSVAPWQAAQLATSCCISR
ncbi:MAG: MerR family transcriptional regulator [Trueperaceae bacterium]|nr:MerR family transcriptional regulator [Trueperaceae bacterium]